MTQGKILQQVRLASGWTQEYVAEQLGTNQFTVARWESGRVQPRPYFRQRLCELFQVSPDVFGWGSGDDASLAPSLPTDLLSQTEKDPLFQELFPADKLTIPPLRSLLIARQRLVECLQSAKEHRLFVITAPAGYGKTTLLCQWCQHTSWPIAWVSLEASDNDPLRFWQYLLKALCKSTSGINQDLTALLQRRPVPSADILARAVLHSFSQIEQDVLLIIDDYHVITTQSIHDSMADFLAHQPPSLHIVLASRTSPPFPLSRLRVRRQLVEIRASDLSCTPEEVEAFFALHSPVRLTEEYIATLAKATEGWMAALQLAAISLRSGEDIAEVLRTFIQGTHHSIVDYLTEEIFQHQPSSIQNFLLHTAILDRLSSPLCAAIVGEGSENSSVFAQEMLEYLERSNLFLIPLDTERRWYRYHYLFSEFLREHLRHTQPQLLPLLHYRATAWYEDQGLLMDAIPHALPPKIST